MNSIVKSLIICLVCTIIIEVFVAFLLKVRDKKDLINVILVNVLTNPLVVSISLYVHVCYGYFYYRICIILLEILVLIVEGAIYKRVLKRKFNPYLLSFLLNVSSYGLGLIINMVM